MSRKRTRGWALIVLEATVWSDGASEFLRTSARGRYQMRSKSGGGSLRVSMTLVGWDLRPSWPTSRPTSFPVRMQERDGQDRRPGISGTASLGGCAGVRLCRVTRRHLRVFHWKSKGADCLGRSMETIRMRKMREVRWTWEGGRMCFACPWTR